VSEILGYHPVEACACAQGGATPPRPLSLAHAGRQAGAVVVMPRRTRGTCGYAEPGTRATAPGGARLMAKRSRTKGMRIENDAVHEEMPTDTIDLNSV
jgi:hypothetical protein